MDSFINSIIPDGLDPTMKGIVTLWLFTTLGYMLRSYPARFYNNFINKYCFYTVSFNGIDDMDNYVKFTKRLQDLIRWQSSFRLTQATKRKVLDYGNYVMWYRKAIIYVSIINNTSNKENGPVNDNPVVTIRALRCFKNQVDDVLCSYTVDEVAFNAISVYKVTNDASRHLAEEQLLDLKYWVVNHSIKNNLLNHVERYTNDYRFVKERGIPRRLTILLSGEPGTGKTTFAKVLATKYKLNIYLVNFGTIVDPMTLIKALPTRNCIVLIEDVDAMSSNVNKRSDISTISPDSSEWGGGTYGIEIGTTNSSTPGTPRGLSLSDILNTLDGIPALNNKIIIMTTNHPENLDPAILRPGRINVRETIERLTSDLIHEYIQVMYPDCEYDKTLEFEPLRGCDLQGYLFFHRSNFEGFMSEMQKHIITPN